MDNLRKFIKTKKQNRVYRYSIRRLSIGVVSCVVGAFVLFSPVKFGNAELSGVVYASGVEPKNSERLGALSIKVQDENRKTIMGVKVKLYNNEHEYIETSDENGNLAFSAKPGDYKYEVISIPKRFEDSTLGVKTIKIESNKVTNGAVINLKNKDVEILGFLTEQEKNELKNGLKNPLNDRMEDRLKGKDNLQALYDKYEEINKKNKNKIIKEAEGKIDKLILLSEEDRGLYKSKLKDSSNKKDIDQIVGEAEEKNIRQGKTKYTLMVKEVDKDGKGLGALLYEENLTVDELNKKIENFKDEEGNKYEVVGDPEIGADNIVKVNVIKIFTVTFDSNGGTPVVAKEVQKGKVAVKPEDPTRKGFKFERWELEGKEYDFNNPVEKNITLKAVWSEIKPEQTKYTLKIKEVDKDGNVISLLKTVEDLTAEKLSEETEKFVDGAEYKDETGNYKVVGIVEMDGTTAVVKVIEVKPEQTKYTLKIKEVDKDGNVISLLKTVEDLTAEKLNKETEKFVDGVDYKDETGNYKVVGTVEMDGTTAVVKVIEVFTVTFDSNGGSQVAPVVAEKGKEVTKPEDPTRKGFKFERWELEGKEYDFTNPVEKNITLKAVWSMKATPIEPIEMVTVTFDSNGGTPVVAKEVQKGKVAVKPEDPTREGFKFERWELEGKEYDFNSPVEKNITLKAVWSMKATPIEPIEMVTVTFDSNGGTPVAAKEVQKGKAVAKPEEPKAEGLTFERWELEGKEYDFNSPVEKNITLKAVWSMKATPLVPGIKKIPAEKIRPIAIRNDNDQMGSIDWRYIKAPSKDAKTEVQKQKTVIEVKIKVGSDILQRTINNHTQEIKMDTKAIIKDGRTMLPIRYVAEALGYTVEWREDTRTAILKDKNTTIEIPVDTNKIIVNGKEIQSDVKPMIENGRTMLPIANVARALGLKDGQDIKWDEAKQEVTIRKEIIN